MLRVKIILPSQIFLDTESDMVNIPGTEGEFAILSHHCKMNANMSAGVITLTRDSSKKHYFVCDGIVQITGAEVNIVSNFVLDITNLNQDELNTIINRLQNDLSKLEKGSIEYDVIVDAITRHQLSSDYIAL